MDNLRGFCLRVPDSNGDPATPEVIEGRHIALLINRVVLHSSPRDRNMSTRHFRLPTFLNIKF
jgi:hypothetical protein